MTACLSEILSIAKHHLVLFSLRPISTLLKHLQLKVETKSEDVSVSNQADPRTRATVMTDRQCRAAPVICHNSVGPASSQPCPPQVCSIVMPPQQFDTEPAHILTMPLHSPSEY